MTTTISIANVGTFTIPTENVQEILNIIQRVQYTTPQRQTNEVLSSHPENEGRTLING